MVTIPFTKLDKKKKTSFVIEITLFYNLGYLGPGGPKAFQALCVLPYPILV